MNKWNINPFDGYNGVKWLPSRTIFMTIHGSNAYGTATPESDIDLRGIAVAPKEYYFGFSNNFEQAEGKEPYDMTVFSLPKFFSLGAKCNPNILEIINTEKEDWIITTPLFENLWKNRSLFLSKRAKHTFAGYAKAQLHRIKSHRNWLLNPVDKEPTREQYGLSTKEKLSQSDLGAINSLIENDVPLDKNVMTLFRQEQNFHRAKQTWIQYQSWKKNRNPKRAELEAKYGYDGKHASHLVRLFNTCKDILEKGEVIVKRPEAKLLLEIKNGAWAYEYLISWADEQEQIINEICEKSTLPEHPPEKRLDDLCLEITEEALKHLK